MNRRQILAAAAAAGVPVPALAAAGPALAVFDERYAEARAFAAAQRRRGAVVIEAQADVGRLWYGPVRAALARGERPRIAGLTTYADFVVIRGCAAEARLRLSHGEIPRGPRSPVLVSWSIS